MIPFIEDLAKNDMFFRSQDFINAFHLDYKVEAKNNFEFVRAFN